jgi:replicative DNA helicase
MSKAGDIETERIVLSHYLARRAADLRDAQVTADHFFHGDHAGWWTAAVSVGPGWTPGDLGIPPDALAVLAGIRPSERDVKRAERRLIRRWQLVHLQRCSRELEEEIRSGELTDSDLALNRVREALGEAEAGGVLDARTHRDVGIALFREWADALKQGTTRCLPMPLAVLQRKLGGWQPGKFYLVGAVTSGHKTTFARMGAWHLAKQGYNPLLWPMEDTASEMAARTFAQEIRQVDTRTFTTYKKPDGITEDDFSELIRSLGNHLDSDASARLRYLDEPMPRLGRVQARVSAESARGLSAVFLDFMQLIQPDRDDTPDTTHWFNVANTLAAMAKRLDIPVIATVQPTQLATREQARLKRPLTLGDLRGGSAIAQSAYGVLLFNRVWGDDGEIDRRYIDINIAKWKNADPETVRFSVARHTDTIMEGV